MTPCDNCPAPCCREYGSIVITTFDAVRLSRALAVPMADFSELRWWEEPTRQYRIMLGPVEEGLRRWYRLQMKKAGDADPADRERCVFLFTVNGRGRCGVHAIRPDVCRVYPTSLADGVIDVDAGGKYCPPGAWQVDVIDVPLFRLWHAHRSRHRLIDNFIVDGWNERVVTFAEKASSRQFHAYVMNAYQELLKRRGDLLDGDRAEDPRDMAALVDESLRAMGWRTDDVLARAASVDDVQRARSVASL